MHQLIDKKKKIILYLLLLFILSTTSGKYTNNQKNYFSKINQINIKGLSSNNNTEIYNKLNNLFYKNILLVEKKEIQKVISQYNIIEEYNVKRIYPSTISINIKPTKFVARLSIDNQLVGANGKLIENKKDTQILPYIFGEFVSKDFLAFKKNIEQSKFNFKDFKTFYFFPSNRWDILTNNDILIKLPQDNFLESLNLAYKIVSSNELTNKDLIDLRVNNNLIIK
ncbi:FtsQ-type POTRA domain-containing protein [Candidatus Pelagibacter sp.]|jgi:cell division protein FtsQ|nr:FtsQ-type POTRA domain-containing protein [Candidatus Pelagibacter sp.]